jgi:hypothetical protein
MGHATATVKDALESTRENSPSPSDTSHNAKLALVTSQEENHNLGTALRHCPRPGGRHAAWADAPAREDRPWNADT